MCFPVPAVGLCFLACLAVQSWAFVARHPEIITTHRQVQTAQHNTLFDQVLSVQPIRGNPRRDTSLRANSLQSTTISDSGTTYQARAVDPTRDNKDKKEAVPTTLPQAIRVFFFSQSGVGPTSVVLILASLVVWRLSMSSLSPVDGIAFLGAIVFWVFQEHFLHKEVLHSEMDWFGKEIHQGHHDKNYFHVSLDPPALMLAWLGTAHFLFRFLFPLPLACTITFGYALAGLVYEWAHFVVHTKVKPRSQFMRRMRDNHIRHHCIDDRYWFAFSCPQVDDLMGTNPDVRVIKANKRKGKEGVAGDLQTS